MPLVVWRASLSLSHWLDSNQGKWLSDKPTAALELGSGTGLLGLFTGKRLAQSNPCSSVTLTDMEESVSRFHSQTQSIELLRANVTLNGLSEAQASCQYLKWGDFAASPLLKEASYDLIVGSDIIYSKHVLTPLA